jgi:hypothetical protein
MILPVFGGISGWYKTILSINWASLDEAHIIRFIMIAKSLLKKSKFILKSG